MADGAFTLCGKICPGVFAGATCGRQLKRWRPLSRMIACRHFVHVASSVGAVLAPRRMNDVINTAPNARPIVIRWTTARTRR